MERGHAPSAPQTPTSTAKDNPSAPAAERWRAAVTEVERASPALANALKHAVLTGMTEGEIAVRMTPGMPLSTVERRRADIEGLFARHFGRPVRLELSKAPAGAEPASPSTAAAGQSLAAAEQAERAERTARVTSAARAHPNIQQATRILDGEVTKIEEL